MTISDKFLFMQTINVKAKKSLGQNFLQDHNILRKEVELADVRGKKVLEIGPGDGRLTRHILKAKPKKLTAIEKDSELAQKLMQEFSSKIEKGLLEIIEGDFLKAELPDFDVVIGNIPYYISSPIIFRLKDYDFEKAILIVQKEFAIKMIEGAGSSNYGRLSVTSQVFFRVKIMQIVQKELFSPQPKVDSAMIMLFPTGKNISKFQEDVIRWLFSHKNKTLRNALLDSGKLGKEDIEDLGEILVRKVRTLEVDEVLEIATKLEKR
jgi:16S rRNA (adenine1518-N6/adenine1519-N6)-dimethyltransferase